jgi:cyclohexadieny/prephenate dehydrogenase
MLFNKIAIVGVGLIGSSLARVIREKFLAKTLIAVDNNLVNLNFVKNSKIVDEVYLDIDENIKDADLIVLATPIGVYGEIAKKISRYAKDGAIVSDVGSVKVSVIEEIEKNIDNVNIVVVGGHPVAGTEKSGAKFGFSDLFKDRWFIITPSARSTQEAVEKITKLWSNAGMNVEIMTPERHDRVMATISHLPHLIAFSMVSTVDELENYEKQDIIKYSASGFRDSTRIAASDPVVWRDIFLDNKEAILEVTQIFIENLIALQKNIRKNNGNEIFDLISRVQKIRRGIVDLNNK